MPNCLLAAAVCVSAFACSTAGDVGQPNTSAAPTVAPSGSVGPSASLHAVWPPVPSSAKRAHVTRIVDGDTIVLDGIGVGYADSRGRPGRHARLIGIDTPETHGRVGCFGAQASAFTKRELNDRDVLVDFDVDSTDRFGRALVYVWKTDGTFFNGALAEEGFALQLTIPPDVRYADVFLRYVRDARVASRGLWSAC
jgi:micrococcal nuclease